VSDDCCEKNLTETGIVLVSVAVVVVGWNVKRKREGGDPVDKTDNRTLKPTPKFRLHLQLLQLKKR